jgi:hypothetical protein
VIVSEPVIKASRSSSYFYDVEALDPNGNVLTYSLIKAPEGMLISSSSGRITWNSSAAAIGSYEISVKVVDELGASDTQDFAINLVDTPLGEIRGRIWNDDNENGELDFSELGLSGLTVFLDSNNNGAFDTGEVIQLTASDDASTTFNESGEYRFTNLNSGTYTVRQLLKSDYIQTSPSKRFQGSNGGISLSGPINLLQPNPDVNATFMGRVGISTDGLGTNSTGTLQAEIPAGSKVEYAFLHIATRSARPVNIEFEQTPANITWLDNPYSPFDFQTGRADVTDLVRTKVTTEGGIFNFLVGETSTVPLPIGFLDSLAYFVEGTSLTVIYSNPSLPERTAVVLEGSLAGRRPLTTILSLESPIDKSDPDFIAQMALGIQFGYQPGGQHSTVSIEPIWHLPAYRIN